MTITVDGSTNTITGATSLVANTAITGTLDASGDFSVATTKLTVASASGNTVVAGTLAVNGAAITTDDTTFTALAGATTLLTLGGTGGSAVVAIPGTLEWSGTTGALTVAGGVYIAKKAMVIGDFAVATNKFTVAAASGNTVVAGTLGVTGDVAVATNKFTVAAATGNTVVAGTLGVTSDVAVATNKFTVAASTGNTVVAGTLGISGATTLTRSTDSASEAVAMSVADTRTGAGATGWAIKGELISNVALGAYSNGLYGLVTFGSTGSCTGLSAGVVGEMVISAGTTGGTYAALEAELVANDEVSTGTDTGFIYANIAGSDATGKTTINTSGHFMVLGTGIVNTADGMFDEVTEQAVNAQARLRIKVGAATWYIPLCDTSALS